MEKDDDDDDDDYDEDYNIINRKSFMKAEDSLQFSKPPF